MRLYHYAPKKNTVLKEGLYSFSKHPDSSKSGYVVFAKSKSKQDIINWLEKVFPGRSKSISCFTEPVQWRGNDKVLKRIVKESALFSFELNDLVKDGLVESIWCRDDAKRKGRKYIHEGYEQYFYEVSPDEIDTNPLPWGKVSKDVRSGAVRHYMIVLKKGIIPPEYLKLERNNLGFFYNLSQSLKKWFVRKK